MYLVEFPPEDLDRDTGGQNKLGDAEEISLVNKISEALVLKRLRNLICGNENERDDGEAEERSKKFKSCVPEEDMQGVVWGREMFQYDGVDMDTGENIVMHNETKLSMAEEAGLPLPPTLP